MHHTTAYLKKHNIVPFRSFGFMKSEVGIVIRQFVCGLSIMVSLNINSEVIIFYLAQHDPAGPSGIPRHAELKKRKMYLSTT